MSHQTAVDRVYGEHTLRSRSILRGIFIILLVFLVSSSSSCDGLLMLHSCLAAFDPNVSCLCSQMDSKYFGAALGRINLVSLDLGSVS